jgi:hypothetical protein
MSCRKVEQRRNPNRSPHAIVAAMVISSAQCPGQVVAPRGATQPAYANLME